MNRKLIVQFGVFVLLWANVFAQESTGVLKPEVKVIGTVTQNSIMLRWSANTPSSWKLANTYGYIIERKTLVRGNEILRQPEIKQLTAQPIKPKPMIEWQSYVKKNDYAAIVAQAIYGEGFDIEMQEGTDPFVSMINMSKAQEQRFSFALYAADQDFEVAKFSGLGFVDKDVKEGERYVYTIRTAIPPEKTTVKSGNIYLGLADYVDLPKPLDFSAVFKDKNVSLSWNYKLLKSFYNSYILERSDDNGGTFVPIGGGPLVNAAETEKNKSNSMFYLDSLPQLNKTYLYRLKGKSSFGQIGPASDIVEGKGIKEIAHNPGITNAKISPQGNTVVVNWEYPDKGMESLAYFELVRSNTIKGAYQTVESNIDKSKRSIIYNNIEGINYFKIVAVGNTGAKRLSFPKMVQLVDDVPPAIPIELTGVIDSTGVVQLRWAANIESDFLGYRVFKAQKLSDEFTQITTSPIKDNKFIDSVKIKSLNPKVFYKIQAFDKRYNPSEFSKIVEIIKPDIIPPTKPVFIAFKTEEQKVSLTWKCSSSIDAKSTLIYKKEKGVDAPWELLATVAVPNNEYTEIETKAGVYLYTILTIDQSGVESEPVKPITITIDESQEKVQINKFTHLVNREEKNIVLNWKYKGDKITEYKLYRAKEEAKPTLYKVLDAKTSSFIDTNLTINTSYRYLLQAIFDSGLVSPISQLEVKY